MRSTPDLATVVTALSKARYEPYLAATSLDQARAWALYRWNADLGALMFERISFVEVALRNAMHRQLCDLSQRRHRNERWFEALAPDFSERTLADIEAARRRVAGRSSAVTPGRVVAELNFGFWRHLLDERYARSLWNPGGRTGLRGAFGDVTKREVADREVTRVFELRNRVAHHEALIKFSAGDLQSTVASMDCLLDWTSPGLRAHLDSSALLSAISQRP